MNDQSDQGDFDDDDNSLFQPQAKNLELEKKIEEPLKQGEKPKEPEIPEVDGESKDYSADDGDDDDFF